MAETVDLVTRPFPPIVIGDIDISARVTELADKYEFEPPMDRGEGYVILNALRGLQTQSQREEDLRWTILSGRNSRSPRVRGLHAVFHTVYSEINTL